MKITDAGRDMRAEDLNGAKMVFSVGYANITAGDNGKVSMRGWCWYEGTEYVEGDIMHGPFRSERAARNDALKNCQMMC